MLPYVTYLIFINNSDNANSLRFWGGQQCMRTPSRVSNISVDIRVWESESLLCCCRKLFSNLAQPPTYLPGLQQQIHEKLALLIAIWTWFRTKQHMSIVHTNTRALECVLLLSFLRTPIQKLADYLLFIRPTGEL